MLAGATNVAADRRRVSFVCDTIEAANLDAEAVYLLNDHELPRTTQTNRREHIRII